MAHASGVAPYEAQTAGAVCCGYETRICCRAEHVQLE